MTTAPETRVTQEDIDWATSAAQHLCSEPDQPAAIRLLADAFARHRQSAEAASRAREERLRWENAELISALEAIQRWRGDCKSYDDECGHPERLFCEDVALIEGYAERVLKRIEERTLTTGEPA